MNENRVLEKFKRQKIITIGQLVEWLKCSVITARRRLKKWQSYTSINKNGRYYTLPHIPVFDENGLWTYRTVLFSKHGNLKQTIVALITDSLKGLSAVEVAELVDLVPNSSFLSRIKSVPGIKREKHQGRFIYLSDHPKIYSRQKQRRATGQRAVGFPADFQAVEILVQLIKHPDIGSWQPKRMKAVRFSLINLPARVVKRSRRLIIRLTKNHLSLEILVEARKKIAMLKPVPCG